MKVEIRKWEIADAKDLASALSNKKILDNLRDGLPYPYTEQDGKEFISAMFATNIASQRVLEKAGFVYEGTLRSNAVKNGKVMDMKMYSMLRKEV